MNLSCKKTLTFLVNNTLGKNAIKLCGILLLTAGTYSFGNQIQAQTAGEIPEELAETIAEMETAANEQNLDELMDYYAENFTNEDGLTAESVEAALEETWATYPQMTYDIAVDSWEEKGDEFVAETTTKITGSQDTQGRVVRLESDIRSRQYFQDGKMVKQEILTEETRLTTGDRPPQIKVNLPETVKVGEKYNFDTIVTEPLDGGVLLGAALEERTGINRYLNPSELELEPLSAGGIYKVVTAPRLEDNHWLSAIVIRGNGITMVTKRVRIEEQN